MGMRVYVRYEAMMTDMTAFHTSNCMQTCLVYWNAYAVSKDNSNCMQICLVYWNSYAVSKDLVRLL